MFEGANGEEELMKFTGADESYEGAERMHSLQKYATRKQIDIDEFFMNHGQKDET